MARKIPSISCDPLTWLLQPENPSIRYYALRRLLDLAQDDPEIQAARQAIVETGPVPAILALQDPVGWWHNPELATKPMYVSTAWQLGFLAELGATAGLPAIQRGVELVLQTVQTGRGDFPPQGSNFHKIAPSDMLCFDGMLTWAFLRLGYDLSDPRLERAVCFLAQALLASDLRCHFNAGLPCAWGGVKALRAMAEVPENQRTPEVQAAIQKGAEFLLDGDLAHAAYPVRKGGRISDHWFRFGFPRSYQSDILQTLVVLADWGYAGDPRLAPALQFVLDKRLPDGTWKCEETIAKMPVALDKKGRPSKWITWQALYVLKAAGISS